VHASILSRFGFVDVCRICASNLWKRAQLSAVSSSHETESGGGASEHTAVSAVDRISLDAAIAKLSNHGEADELGAEILAAAIALRDSSGRDRLSALRSIAGIWNVARQEKVGGKWKNRSLTALAKDIEVAVCDAALRWEHHRVAEHTDQPDLAIYDSGVIAEVPQNKKRGHAVFQNTLRTKQSHALLKSTWVPT